MKYTLYIRRGKKLLSSSWKANYSWIIYYVINSSTEFQLEFVYVLLSLDHSGLMALSAERRQPSLLWEIEALVIYLFSSLHHITWIMTSGNMGRSPWRAGKASGDQVVWALSCYDNDGVIKIIVTWFLIVLECVLRRVGCGEREREAMNPQLETHVENRRPSWQLWFSHFL